MKIQVEIPDYNRDAGLQIPWNDGAGIEVSLDGREVIIAANGEGLTSLARQLLMLAQEEIPNGHHVHLTDVSGLFPGSLDLTMRKE